VLYGDNTGGTWILWEDFRNQVNFQVQLNHLDGDGSSVWPGGEIAIAPASGDQGKTAIVGNGINGVWTVWIDNRRATVSLYAQEIDIAGKLLQGDAGMMIATDLHKPSSPKLALLSPRRAVVCWTERPKKNQWTLHWAFLGAPSAQP